MPFKYPVEQLTQYELEGEYPNLWDTIRKDFPDLSNDHWVKIASLVVGTCPHCHDAEIGCKCWNDE